MRMTRCWGATAGSLLVKGGRNAERNPRNPLSVNVDIFNSLLKSYTFASWCLLFKIWKGPKNRGGVGRPLLKTPKKSFFPSSVHLVPKTWLCHHQQCVKITNYDIYHENLIVILQAGQRRIQYFGNLHFAMFGSRFQSFSSHIDVIYFQSFFLSKNCIWFEFKRTSTKGT